MNCGFKKKVFYDCFNKWKDLSLEAPPSREYDEEERKFLHMMAATEQSDLGLFSITDLLSALENYEKYLDLVQNESESDKVASGLKHLIKEAKSSANIQRRIL